MESILMHRTKSLCPVCLDRIDAAYEARKEGVYLTKTCKKHGYFEVRVWLDADDFMRHLNLNEPQKPRHPERKVIRGCPYDCGICEEHLQESCCVLLEVTNRCNLNCPVCFAGEKTDGMSTKDPDMEQIASYYDMLLRAGGPYNIQLSGGEPTMRDDLPDIIRLGRSKGFTFFQLNTNGIRIASEPAYLEKLKEAGLNTVFLQFDSPKREAVLELRGRDITKEKERAIANCGLFGVGVVLVPTLKKGCNDGDIFAILNYAKERMPTVRGVHFQPMSYFGRYDVMPRAEERITIPELLMEIERQSGGRLLADDFRSGRAEHALCSIHADYVIEDSSVNSTKRTTKKNTENETKRELWKLQGKSSASQECCCGTSSDTARETVAYKWSGPAQHADKHVHADKHEKKGINVSALDAFLEERSKKTLAISAMAFQDAWTVDLNRLKRCHINVVSPDGRLIPFCAYNITSIDGKSLYRSHQYRQISNIIQADAIKEVTGGLLRPGGFELTDKALKLAGLITRSENSHETIRKKILDIGCGSGETVGYINRNFYAEASGIDIDSKHIEEAAHKYPDFRFWTADIENADTKSLKESKDVAFKDTYDVVISECVLSKLSNRPAAFKNIFRILKKDGRLILTGMYKRNKREDQDREIKENMAVLLAELGDCGFEITYISDETRYLKQLTGQLIMKYGMTIPTDEKQDFGKKKPNGYYLLIMRPISTENT